MCPTSPRPRRLLGREVRGLYRSYEKAGKGKKTIKAQQLWFAILESQVETGGPYMLFKDACNRKSNQQNLGTIKSSNLCTEIVEFHLPEETAVCNLASIAALRDREQPRVPHGQDGGEEAARLARRQEPPPTTPSSPRSPQDDAQPEPRTSTSTTTPWTPRSASTCATAPSASACRASRTCSSCSACPLTRPAQKLNAEIFETIYFAALTGSNAIAAVDGSYETYPGSPVSKGILQPDMWGVTEMPGGDRHDWTGLREKIAASGVRNSLLVAPMPTASTSQILGNNECFEPYTSNIYARRVLSVSSPW